MTRQLLLTVVCLGSLCVTPAFGQQNIQVQLPTFNMTTVSTMVSVPDGGTGLLGGIGRASEGSVERGVPLLSSMPYLNRMFKNRGIGRDFGSSNMTVIPRIIIQEEEELRQTGVSADTLDLLTSSGRGGGIGTYAGSAVDAKLARQAEFLSNNLARHSVEASPLAGEKKLPSVEEIKRRNQLAKVNRTAEAAEFFAKGTRAEADGKPAVAKVFYKMAATRAEGELRQQIATRLAILAGAQQGTKLAER